MAAFSTRKHLIVSASIMSLMSVQSAFAQQLDEIIVTPTAFRDASGDVNLFSPEISFNVNLDYRKEIGSNLEGRGLVNLNYSDEYFTAAELDPIYGLQPSYTKIDARISLEQMDKGWELALIGKTLTDELISGTNNDQPLVPGNGFAQAGKLRSFAIQASYDW